MSFIENIEDINTRDDRPNFHKVYNLCIYKFTFYTDIIVNNRNQFVDIVSLKKRIFKNPSRIMKYFEISENYSIDKNIKDHWELYALKEKSKYLGLFSPYNPIRNRDIIEKAGFHEIFQLYREDCTTFIKIINYKDRG